MKNKRTKPKKKNYNFTTITYGDYWYQFTFGYRMYSNFTQKNSFLFNVGFHFIRELCVIEFFLRKRLFINNSS